LSNLANQINNFDDCKSHRLWSHQLLKRLMSHGILVIKHIVNSIQ